MAKEHEEELANRLSESKERVELNLEQQLLM